MHDVLSVCYPGSRFAQPQSSVPMRVRQAETRHPPGSRAAAQCLLPGPHLSTAGNINDDVQRRRQLLRGADQQRRDSDDAGDDVN